MVSVLKIASMFSWPRFPEFPDHFYDPEKVIRARFSKRYFYDWTVFTPEGLMQAERYWDEAAAELAALLPERLQQNPAKWRGINLGTFDGTFQKAWMRRGYSMYGIEKVNSIEQLHAYGCEGHKDDIFDLSTIPDRSYDFGILDRVLCQRQFYEDPPTMPNEQGEPIGVFSKIRRVLNDKAAFIGVLYEWYNRDVVAELASFGGLTLWPHKSGRLAFCVDFALPATEMPDVRIVDLSSPYFIAAKIGKAQVRFFVPTNEVVSESDETRSCVFAPLLREAARGSRQKRALVRSRFVS